MSSHRALAERFAQTLTDHDLDAFAELLNDDYINHNRYAQPGKDGSVAIFAAFLDAFAEFRVEIDDVVEAGTTIVGRYTYRGRHTGHVHGHLSQRHANRDALDRYLARPRRPPARALGRAQQPRALSADRRDTSTQLTRKRTISTA